MNRLIGIIAILAFVTSARAQVLNPRWLAESVLQIRTDSQQKILPLSRAPSNLTENLRQGFIVRESQGWTLIENHPETVRSKILLLPGFLGTDFLYHRMLRDPAVEKNGIQLIAGLPPGFGGLSVPESFDFSIPAYARMVSQLAAEEGVSLIVGHSLMATVLIEVLKQKSFSGTLVLLAPALEPDEEPLSLRTLDLASRSAGMSAPAWVGVYDFLNEFFKPYFSPDDSLLRSIAVKEARKTPRSIAQKILLQYFNHLRSEPSPLLQDMNASSTGVHLVLAGQDPVQIKPEHLEGLKKTRRVGVHVFPHASHMIMLDEARSLNTLLTRWANHP